MAGSLAWVSVWGFCHDVCKELPDPSHSLLFQESWGTEVSHRKLPPQPQNSPRGCWKPFFSSLCAGAPYDTWVNMDILSSVTRMYIPPPVLVIDVGLTHTFHTWRHLCLDGHFSSRGYSSWTYFMKTVEIAHVGTDWTDSIPTSCYFDTFLFIFLSEQFLFQRNVNMGCPRQACWPWVLMSFTCRCLLFWSIVRVARASLLSI